jgi:hypothetical protein
MLGRVTLVRTDVSEERSVSLIRVTRIGEIGTTLALTTEVFCEEIVSFNAIRYHDHISKK